MPAIKGDMYINTHCNYSQPTLIKLDNENIGGHCYSFTDVNTHHTPVLTLLSAHGCPFGVVSTSNSRAGFLRVPYT